MNHDTDNTGKQDETFATRWSRRKRAVVRANSGAQPHAEKATAEHPAAEPSSTAPELPSPDSLGDNDDYSLFMAAGVDDGLRRAALRRLFRAPQYNVRDGLCEYDDDYTQRTPLGDWVVAKLREQRERWLQAEQQPLNDTEPDGSAAIATASSANVKHEGPPMNHEDEDPA
ncbi:MAG TPA: DUF3306 domain-containing protein [Gammaproteobacteria bacterium]|nr:DUF3306 domain-containing protein [Gammaproteobacteria bacterium]